MSQDNHNSFIIKIKQSQVSLYPPLQSSIHVNPGLGNVRKNDINKYIGRFNRKI